MNRQLKFNKKIEKEILINLAHLISNAFRSQGIGIIASPQYDQNLIEFRGGDIEEHVMRILNILRQKEFKEKDYQFNPPIDIRKAA